MNKKMSTYHKLEGSSMKLDEIMKNQIALDIKFILGFEEGEPSNGPKVSNVEFVKIEQKKIKVD